MISLTSRFFYIFFYKFGKRPDAFGKNFNRQAGAQNQVMEFHPCFNGCSPMLSR